MNRNGIALLIYWVVSSLSIALSINYIENDQRFEAAILVPIAAIAGWLAFRFADHPYNDAGEVLGCPFMAFMLTLSTITSIFI